MITDYNKIPDFNVYINEVIGLVNREMYRNVDVSELSKIIHDFMQHIKQNPTTTYETVEFLFNKAIKIIYKPTNNGINGETRKDEIYLYKEVNDENFLNVKYTLAHELVHMISGQIDEGMLKEFIKNNQTELE